jgi:hypothetical protein
MANASVELSGTRAVSDLVGGRADQIFGACLRQQTLAISGSTTTLTTAVTAAEITAANGDLVARVVTDDTGCYVAKGTTPDPTAASATGATTARRWIPAGGEFVMRLVEGDKVAVHS